MAPKAAAAPAPVEAPAPVPAPEELGPLKRVLWSYGVNDHIFDLPEPALKGFPHSGIFRADFAALCARCGTVPHAAFAIPRDAEAGTAEASALGAQSILMDRATLQVARHVLPTTKDVKALRFSGCRFDAEMLGLLKGSFADSCTVTTLQIDWNPLEVPHEEPAEVRRIAAAGTQEELEALEAKRAKRQLERTLREFADRLQARYGDVGEALKDAAQAIPGAQRAVAMFVPLDISAWTSLWSGRVTLTNLELEHVFHLLDSSDPAHGDGLVPLVRVEHALESALASVPDGQDEEKDPLGVAFAELMDASSTLELVSFRYCNIGRVEAQAIGKAIGSPSPHLRALNLWGNCICDRGAAALARGLETNFGLQYLGLGRNLVTHVGLQFLCKPLGVNVFFEKSAADPVVKSCRELAKDRDKKLKTPVPPKRDGSGRERYTPELYVPTCEDFPDPETKKQYWLFTRNVALKTLVLEKNPVADAVAVRRLLPFGCGDLVLKGTPCAEELLAMEAAAAEGMRDEAEGVLAAGLGSSPSLQALGRPLDISSEAAESILGGEAAPMGSALDRPLPPFKGAAAQVTGWRLVLR